MEDLAAILSKGLAGAEEAKAFVTIEKQPHVRTLVGLLIAQGQSFATARQGRKQLYKHLVEQKVNIASDDEMWTALLAIDDKQWSDWGVAKSVRTALAAMKPSLQTKSLEQLLETGKQYRIGPWTRKAFWIMTSPELPDKETHPNSLLTEDSWIRQRWDLLIRHLKLNPQDYPLNLHTCQSLNIHPIRLSRLLWRLTKDGVRKLVQNSSKVEQAAEWFIR